MRCSQSRAALQLLLMLFGLLLVPDSVLSTAHGQSGKAVHADPSAVSDSDEAWLNQLTTQSVSSTPATDLVPSFLTKPTAYRKSLRLMDVLLPIELMVAICMLGTLLPMISFAVAMRFLLSGVSKADLANRDLSSYRHLPEWVQTRFTTWLMVWMLVSGASALLYIWVETRVLGRGSTLAFFASGLLFPWIPVGLYYCRFLGDAWRLRRVFMNELYKIFRPEDSSPPKVA